MFNILPWTGQKKSVEILSEYLSSEKEFMKLVAPSARASSSFAGVDEKAVTSQPQALRNCRAIWPSPPIPMTATLSVGLMSN